MIDRSSNENNNQSDKPYLTLRLSEKIPLRRLLTNDIKISSNWSLYDCIDNMVEVFGSPRLYEEKTINIIGEQAISFIEIFKNKLDSILINLYPSNEENKKEPPIKLNANWLQGELLTDTYLKSETISKHFKYVYCITMLLPFLFAASRQHLWSSDKNRNIFLKQNNQLDNTESPSEFLTYSMRNFASTNAILIPHKSQGEYRLKVDLSLDNPTKVLVFHFYYKTSSTANNQSTKASVAFSYKESQGMNQPKTTKKEYSLEENIQNGIFMNFIGNYSDVDYFTFKVPPGHSFCTICWFD